MIRRLFLVLLALSLVVNGYASPLSMATGALGDCAGHAHGASPDGQAEDAQTEIEHHGHHGHAKAMDDGEAEVESVAHGECCAGGICLCGCMLPPAVALQAVSVTGLPVKVPVAVAPSLPRLAHHRAPPLRPPAR